jgi:hypothetical protein
VAVLNELDQEATMIVSGNMAREALVLLEDLVVVFTVRIDRAAEALDLSPRDIGYPRTRFVWSVLLDVQIGEFIRGRSQAFLVQIDKRLSGDNGILACGSRVIIRANALTYRGPRAAQQGFGASPC